MIEFKKKIKIIAGGTKTSIYAKHYKVGVILHDDYGKRWEVGEDVNFDKFWFREAKK